MHGRDGSADDARPVPHRLGLGVHAPPLVTPARSRCPNSDTRAHARARATGRLWPLDTPCWLERCRCEGPHALATRRARPPRCARPHSPTRPGSDALSGTGVVAGTRRPTSRATTRRTHSSLSAVRSRAEPRHRSCAWATSSCGPAARCARPRCGSRSHRPLLRGALRRVARHALPLASGRLLA
eukprot:4846209-Prymnesium_polylepis.1